MKIMVLLWSTSVVKDSNIVPSLFFSHFFIWAFSLFFGLFRPESHPDLWENHSLHHPLLFGEIQRSAQEIASSTMIFMIESLSFHHFHILVGIFHYRTWLVYSNDGLPQIALGLHEHASWMHTHLVSFVELSYTYSSSASVAWQSLLTHIDIYWWASP